MKKSTKRAMREFDKDIGGYSPTAETWNAIAAMEEDNDLVLEEVYRYFLGLYRGILVGQNGKKWGRKSKHALWKNITAAGEQLKK